jgi:ferritin-like metal-binding protein YciE
MDDSLLPPYFRRFRRLYSCELQLMSFLPELQSRTGSRHLVEEIGNYIHLCRERRNALEMLAAGHPVSAAGDQCSEMAKLISQNRHMLADDAVTHLQNDFVSDICEAVHCKLIQDYSLLRSFASKLQLPEDAKAFEGMVDRLIGAFPRLWDRMDVMPSEVVV